MPIDTENQNQVTDEQLESKIGELSQKTDRSEEETTELNKLKEDRQTRYQKRIDTLSWKAKDAEERYGKADDRVRELEREVEDLKKSKSEVSTPSVSKETLEIGEKKYYTDKALRSMIDAGEITEAEAYTHQQERIEEAAADKAYKRLKGEQVEQEEKNLRVQDQKEVLTKYPQFSNKHKDFNSEDPLYKEATRIYEQGYFSNPRGLSLAIEEAKKILRITDKNPDISDDLNVYSPSAPEAKSKKEKEIPLTDDEREQAIKQFTKGDVINPSTNRPYTESEAVAKAQKAKNERSKSRRIT